VIAFPAKHHEHKNSQNQHGQNARRAHNVHHDESIFSGCGIVLVAVEQRVVGRRADFSFRSLDQSETNIPTDTERRKSTGRCDRAA
jgi:hypothetical protein